MNKPIHMALAEAKKTSGKFDTTYKVALYPIDKDELICSPLSVLNNSSNPFELRCVLRG